MNELLSFAINDGNSEAVKNLLSTKKIDKEFVDSNGQTPLLQAIKNNQLEIVKILLAEGVKTNELDEEGVSPLLQAVLNQKTEILKALLIKDADKNKILENGKTVFHFTAALENPEILSKLLNYFHQHLPQNSHQIDQIVQIDQKDAIGLAPFHWAIKNGNLQNIKVLKKPVPI